jgi:hypothetical protein
MPVLTRLWIGLVAALSSPAIPSWQEPVASQDRIVLDPGLCVIESDDLDRLGGRAHAAVIATFVGAAAHVREHPVEGQDGAVLQTVEELVTTMSFDIHEIVKNDPRLPSRALQVEEWAGGGEYTRSKPHAVLRMSQLAEQMTRGHVYFLFLSWFEPRSTFTPASCAGAVFDLTGNRATGLDDATDFARRTIGMEKDQAIQVLREAAMAAPPRDR